MRRRVPSTRLLAACVVSSVLPGRGAAQECPPIPGGTDVFPATGKMVLDFSLASNSPPEVVRLSSERLADTIVVRQDQVGDTIATEMVQLALSGQSLVLGPVALRLGSFGPSVAAIAGVQQDPVTCALVEGDAFFEVFVELGAPSRGETWFATEPLRPIRILGSPDEGNPIRDTPPHPGTGYFFLPGAAVLLFDENLEPAAEVFDVHHELGVYRSCLEMPAGGESCAKTRWSTKFTIFDPFAPGGFAADLHLRGPYRHLRGNLVDPGDGRDLVQWLRAEVAASGADAGETSCLGLVTLRLAESEASRARCSRPPRRRTSPPAPSSTCGRCWRRLRWSASRPGHRGACRRPSATRRRAAVRPSSPTGKPCRLWNDPFVAVDRDGLLAACP